MKAIPWWAVAAASAGPVLLIGGFFVAAAIQPASYDPVRDTISELAERGATHPWVMTSALAGLGLCYLLIALGLEVAGRTARVLLASGGVATLLIAVFREPGHGYSLAHELAVIAAALTCCTWPVFASHRADSPLLLTRNLSFAAAGVSLGLAAWYALRDPRRPLGSRRALRGGRAASVAVRRGCNGSAHNRATYAGPRPVAWRRHSVRV